MVTYQFQVDEETWTEWKNTVPRSKSLDTRLRELIEADTEGRVREESLESAPEPEPAPEPTPTEDVAHVGEERSPAPIDEDLREQLREELAGSGDLLEARVDELLKMYDVLRDRGEAEREELLDVVDVDATKYQDRESVWSNMVKGKDTLRALPGVEKPPTGRTVWTHTEEP